MDILIMKRHDGLNYEVNEKLKSGAKYQIIHDLSYLQLKSDEIVV